MELNYLVDTYLNKEDWHETKMELWQVEEHYRRQLDRNNVTFILDSEDNIAGYLEIYWLNNYQLEKIINGKYFDVLAENLNEGDFVYVASAYIEEELRHKGYIHDLNRMMKEKHHGKRYTGIIYEDHASGKFSFYKKGEI